MTEHNQDIAQSPNPADERRAQLAALIPEAFSEGRLDVAALKRALGEGAVIESGERYALTWAGKADAYKVLQIPSSATLRPERDKSVNFDQAQHVFIEGENLEVLKVLQKAYFGKVKLIYIDPPYNTGSDSFIYPDRFQESKEDYLRRINDLADDGTLMREGFFRKNGKENGHYHSNWLSMMLPRLYIARNLLREDGVIFVSCDDNEVHNLRCLMDEVFGEENFIAQFVWKSRVSEDTRATTGVSTDHEYLLAYSRTEEAMLRGAEKNLEKFSNIDNDPRGPWRSADLTGLANKDARPNLHYDLIDPATGVNYGCPPKGWRYEWETMCKKIAEGRVLFPANGKGRPRHKLFLEEIQSLYKNMSTVITEFSTGDGTKEVNAQLGPGVFSFPKPSGLIALLAEQVMADGDLLVDFFAGSASSFEAISLLNARNGLKRKSLLVQLPEAVAEKSEAAKRGFKTIADIARERMRRSLVEARNSEDLVSSMPAEVEGFKSFLLAPSNFKQWRGDGIDTPEQLAAQIPLFAKGEKDGAQVEDMLYELLLKFGQELTTPIETLEVAGGRVFALHRRKMLFLLEPFADAMIYPLIDLKPEEIIAIDGAFQDSDVLKTNLYLQCRDTGIKFTCL
jgi:adenine-specific DNA-methyltransferase